MIEVDLLFVLATAAFAWGLSLATYRWIAVHNGWPMGEWQAHRPGLPIAIGVFTMGMAAIFALDRGVATLVVLPLFGLLCALAWTALTKVGAQSALLLGPAALLALVVGWVSATPSTSRAARAPERGIIFPTVEERAPGRGIATDRQLPPLPAERR